MNLIKSDYSGHAISFNEDGWINATEIASRFGKEVHEWLRLPATVEYIDALADIFKSGIFPVLNPSKMRGLKPDEQSRREMDNTRDSGEYHKVEKSHFVKTKRGRHNGGTWLHPDLAVLFARWLDVRFAIWCDRQIKEILHGTHPHFDWKRMRHAASASYQMMAGSLQRFRASQGKDTLPHHYINESKLINFVLIGSYTPVDRSILTEPQLTLLAKLEIQNGILIGAGLARLERKDMLMGYRDSLISPVLVHDQPLIEEAA